VVVVVGRVVEVEFSGTCGIHDNVKDRELSGGERANHDATGAKPSTDLL
jgi:hypothetical protein